MQASQVVGLSDESVWSQTEAKDTILVTLELTSDGTFSAKEYGNNFLASLIDLLKKRQPQDKQAFERLVTQFIDASIIRSHITSLIVGMVTQASIFLFCKSSGTAIVKRGDLWSEVVSGEGLVSGVLKDQDVLICTTRTFNKLLPNETVMEKFTIGEDLQRASEKLGSLLHNFDNSKGAAAVFALFRESNQASKPIVSEIQPLPLPTPQLAIPAIQKTKMFTQVSEKLSNLTSRLRFTALTSPKKRVLIIALVLLGILAGSFIVGIGQPKKTVQNTEIESRLESITHQIEEGEGLVDLNNLRARTLLSEAETTLSDMQSKFEKGTKERIQIDDLLTRAQTALSASTKSYKIDNPSVFLDLTVVKAEALAQNFSVYENKLAILDNKNISIISSDIDSQSSAIVGGGNKTPNPTLIASHGNNIFVLTSDGLVKIDTSSKSQQLIVKNLKEVGQAIDMVGFGGNVYILDAGTRKIWKFMAIDKGYSQAQSYLAQGETLDLLPLSLAIDGSVWVLGENRVKKYTKGAPFAINLQGLDTQLVNSTVLFTDDGSKNLYILDKGGNRIVVFDKEGVYNSQYIWSGISGVSDFVVSEKAKKILLLSGSNIFSIDLK